ncbi:ABC transporter ATP-binding protein [Schaalia sp. 19OD2882]|uniref:ABC transporter ATP-binding protein n=1 Tax=Schaalia sp. 19OD2882 TaxID=2794089 RepID=UPI001C1F0132|nr:ABC transporter ATP-binding protein [Schaalia sp. 19OD2882]QWW19709.1 ABC transporter ATP-binding protein [Schaalia sp. 19OD2882]
MSIIDVHKVTRTYGRGHDAYTAVDSVSFGVERGELVSLLGVNGAGKTSLLEVLEGIAPATSGQVLIDGLDPLKDRELVRARTGIMLQEAGFAGALTVAETLRMWAGTLTTPRPVAEALDLVDLAHRARVRVRSLSGGERRRLDLAMATLGRPDILFLDEPTTGLDPASRRRTWELVRAMLDQGTTVLLTTHYLEEAEELSDRVLVMAGGRIRAQGSLQEIVASQPARISFLAPPLRAHTGGMPTGIDEGDLLALPNLVDRVRWERGRVHLASGNLQVTLSELLRLAARRGVVLEGLDARSASLEQAFLALTESPVDHPVNAAA